MTRIAAAIVVEDRADLVAALEAARAAVRDGAGLIEWRIDAIAEDERTVAELVRDSPLPCIVTCRSAAEGGAFDGDDADRISLLEALAVSEQPPRYVDIELETYRRSANLRQKVGLAVDHPDQVRDVQTSLILSSHDFDGRPADLLQRLAAMAEAPACSVIKLAWRARSLRDNLEAFDLLTDRPKPMIALCMGPFGLPSRVLAPKFGGLVTFAAAAPGAETAPGQTTVEDLQKRYRFASITPRTAVYGVIGWPVEHSRSPDLHNAGFDATGHDGVYLPLPVPPEYEHFKATVGALVEHPRLDFRGASVTLPHKTHLVRFVEERGGTVESLAARIGAANTLVVDDKGRLRCTNTDAAAAVTALARGMAIDESDLGSRRIAVLGAGGVARAVAAGLADTGCEVVIVNRTAARAAALAAILHDQPRSGSGRTRVKAAAPSELACGCFHAFVNCTPIGMAGGPEPDGSPLPDEVHLDDTVTVMDTVYVPVRTPLIQEAESRGARAIPGIDMFVRQAKDQFAQWTGSEPPDGLFEKVLQ